MTSKPKTAERKRGSGAQFVYSILRDEILDLTLLPGSPIDEIRLSERLSMFGRGGEYRLHEPAYLL